MPRNPRFHGWRDSQCLVNPDKVVIHEVQAHGMLEVLHLLAEGIGQPGKTAVVDQFHVNSSGIGAAD